MRMNAQAPYSFSDWQTGKHPKKGWDCADAVDDGWSKDQLDAFMRATARPWSPPQQKPAGEPAERVEPAAAPSQRPKPASPVAAARTIRQDAGKALILDRRDPLPSARKLLTACYAVAALRTLHHHRGSFYEWNGSCYREADHDAIHAAIWAFLDQALCHTPEKELGPFQPNRSRVGDVFAALSAACNLPASIETPAWLASGDMLPAGELLAVENGLLHLPTGTLHAPTPAYFGLNAADVSFDPDAPEPTEWLRFLDQIWPDDRQSIETLQDLFGYLLAPDTSQQKIALIVGPKRSGKGTVARVLTGLLGHGSVAAPTLASLATNFGLAPLIGKPLGIIGDARLGSRADQAAIAERLLSISGEDSLTIDRKFLPAWTGRLPIRFVIMTNELPRLADASGALASRFVVLTMENSFFGREDRGLGNRLLGELPGILNWARAGYIRLRQRGYFLQPESARDAIDELEALGSPVAAFVKQRCTVAPGLQCLPERVFEEWKVWCEANGRKEAGTLQSFGRDLRAVVSGLKVSRPRVEGQQVRIYEGIDIAGSKAIEPKESMADW
ncbi:phage/plasmid primase, P4 family [Mesorhizobium sp. M1006]|uniref:DNA primase family protein n=1 Tax=Mesorhizobium sp. M1006 TaxID=2957048 RepID=UPI00333CF2D1